MITNYGFKHVSTIGRTSLEGPELRVPCEKKHVQHRWERNVLRPYRWRGW